MALLFLSDDEAFIEKIKQNVTGQPIIAGNVAEVRETVLAYQAAGVDELIVPDFTLGRGSRQLATLDQFIKEVASVAR